MLKLEHVTKEFVKGKGIFDIPCSFEAGTITGILGSNGSGKTTLLRSILGLCHSDEGTILYDEAVISEQYQRVALISESGSFLPYMDAAQYGKFLKDYYERFQMKLYEEILKQFHVELDRKLVSLSRGQQLKVELAAGFAMRADLLILDEPFTTLDVYAKEDTVKLLLKQFHETQTVLIATHNLEEIEHIIDRCIVLKEGHIVEDIMKETLNEQGKDLRALLDTYRPES